MRTPGAVHCSVRCGQARTLVAKCAQTGVSAAPAWLRSGMSHAKAPRRQGSSKRYRNRRRSRGDGVTAGLRSSWRAWRAWRLGVRHVLSRLRGRENPPPVSGTNRSIGTSTACRFTILSGRNCTAPSGCLAWAMIAGSAKVTARNCPQMSQMFTDEEKHRCSSVDNFPPQGLGGNWPELPTSRFRSLGLAGCVVRPSWPDTVRAGSPDDARRWPGLRSRPPER